MKSLAGALLYQAAKIGSMYGAIRFAFAQQWNAAVFFLLILGWILKTGSLGEWDK